MKGEMAAQGGWEDQDGICRGFGEREGDKKWRSLWSKDAVGGRGSVVNGSIWLCRWSQDLNECQEDGVEMERSDGRQYE